MYTIYKNIDRKYFLIESNIKLILLNTIKFLSILIFENLIRSSVIFFFYIFSFYHLSIAIVKLGIHFNIFSRHFIQNNNFEISLINSELFNFQSIYSSNKILKFSFPLYDWAISLFNRLFNIFTRIVYIYHKNFRRS